MKNVRLLAGLAAGFLISVPCVRAEKTPPKPLTMASPEYPAALTDSGTNGTATVLFTIKADGSVADATVTEATDPAFGEATVAALAKWKFDPAKENGAAVDMKVKQQFKFQAPVEQVLNRLAGRKLFVKLTEPALDEAALGAKPVPKAKPRAPYPKSLLGTKTKADVKVAFIVTPEGRPINPTVLGEPNNAFVIPALMATSALEFAPPMKDGKPVYVTSDTVITFEEAPPPPAPSATVNAPGDGNNATAGGLSVGAAGPGGATN